MWYMRITVLDSICNTYNLVLLFAIYEIAQFGNKIKSAMATSYAHLSWAYHEPWRILVALRFEMHQLMEKGHNQPETPLRDKYVINGEVIYCHVSRLPEEQWQLIQC